MNTDPIIEKLHQVRDQFAARSDCDVAAMVAYLRERQQKEKSHPAVSFAKPRLEIEKLPTEATQNRPA